MPELHSGPAAHADCRREKNLLRDLIDQSLLVQRAKDDNINVDAT